MHERRVAVVTIRAMLLGGVCLLGLAAGAHAGSASWSYDGDDNWSTGSRWGGGTPADGADNTATFSLNITANRTVTLDSTRTIGQLYFDDTGSSGDSVWVLSGASALTLDTTAGTPTITSVSWGNRVAVVLQGSDGLAFAGAGNLRLESANTYTGTTILGTGNTVAVVNNKAFGDSTLSLAGGRCGQPATTP